MEGGRRSACHASLIGDEQRFDFKIFHFDNSLDQWKVKCSFCSFDT